MFENGIRLWHVREAASVLDGCGGKLHEGGSHI
jgi:hypothetical protein